MGEWIILPFIRNKGPNIRDAVMVQSNATCTRLSELDSTIFRREEFLLCRESVAALL
jgi:hypothetical protein